MARSPKKSADKQKKNKNAAKKKKAPATPTKRAKLSAKEYAPLAPYLRIKGAREAVDFYKKAFNASVRMIMDAEDKVRIMHADLIINGGEIMLSDTFPEFGTAVTTAPVDAKTTTVSLHLQVNDADKWWKRAIEAGCSIVMPLEDQFWGDRFGMIKDPFGHVWSIASKIKKKRGKK